MAFCYYVSWSLSPKVSFTDALKGPPRRTGLVLACENFFLPGNGVLGREMCVAVCSDGFFSLCLDFENTGESSVSGAKCGTPLGAWAELGSP